MGSVSDAIVLERLGGVHLSGKCHPWSFLLLRKRSKACLQITGYSPLRATYGPIFLIKLHFFGITAIE